MITITDEMREAIALIENTNEPLYITGKAGTGKTTFLKYLVENIKKQFIIAAPTGVAAVNAGGITLHSFLNIPFGVLTPHSVSDSKFYPKKKQLVNAIDVLVIDEISMVRADVIDFVDKKLRIYRSCDKPFGGVQVIMFGDLHQLPPVVTSAEKEALSYFYRGPHFFEAAVWREQGFHIIELTHIFRQSDEGFIKILNDIRNYQLAPEDIDKLEEIRNKEVSKNYDSNYIHICSHKNDVIKINTELLGQFTHTYEAELDDGFSESSMPCDDKLQLRVGARVMTLTNDKEGRYYNGSLGIITNLSNDKVTVALDEGYEVELDKYTWEQCEYKTEKDEEGKPKVVKTVKGSCKQFPVTLAWAITIHKSQGLTFDKIVIHSKGMFCSGQLYVALSRCRTLEGIISDNFISQKMIFPDNKLSAFEKASKERGNIFDRATYRMMYNEDNIGQ